MGDAKDQTTAHVPPPPVTVEQFIETVVKLELSTLDKCRAVLASLKPDQQSDVQLVARAFQNASLITALQSRNIATHRADMLVVSGDYVICELLGRGGMGEVFKALHKSMSRIVAIKFVALRAAKDADVLSRFQREVRAAGQLISWSDNRNLGFQAQER